MNLPISRRDFLAASLSFAAKLQASSKVSEPRVSFPSAPRERLAVATYPFRAYISPGDARNATKPQMTLAQFADAIRGKFNVSGIEPWSHHFESVEPDYLRELSASFKKAGLRVVNIPCDVHAQLCGSADERSASLDTYHKWIDAALVLGAPSIRVHVPRTPAPDDLSCAVSGLKSLADYGAQKNIVVNLENDDPRTEDPDRVLKVIQAIGSPYLRSLPDFCNSMQIHNDEDYNARALASLFPHAFNISHVKDLEIVRGQELRVNVNRIFSIAKKAGYRGYFSMECEGSKDPYEGTRNLIEASLKNLSAS